TGTHPSSTRVRPESTACGTEEESVASPDSARRPSRLAPRSPSSPKAMNVLILSSSMGAGHDGAGRELIARLEAQGHRAPMHDYLDALPLGIGHFIRWNYQLQLRYAPWSYENSYHMWPRIYGL